MPESVAQQFARAVAEEMYRLRGWALHNVPAFVRDDVFATLNRHDGIYSRGFAHQLAPVTVALNIQHAEWSL